MTTKKELREALQRLADAAERACPVECMCERQRAVQDARSLLARPARVVGWRLREPMDRVTTWRLDEDGMVWTCRAMARNTRKNRGGKLTMLVVR